MVVQYATGTQLHVRAHYAVRPNLHIVRNFCGRINNCCRMYVRHNSILTLSMRGCKQKMALRQKRRVNDGEEMSQPARVMVE